MALSTQVFSSNIDTPQVFQSLYELRRLIFNMFQHNLCSFKVFFVTNLVCLHCDQICVKGLRYDKLVGAAVKPQMKNVSYNYSAPIASLLRVFSSNDGPIF